MKNKLCYLLLIIIYFSFPKDSWADQLKITGKVIEGQSKQPVPFATVAIFDLNSDQPIMGATTLEDGTFDISVGTDNIYIEISFMGFKSKKFTDIKPINNTLSLGTIVLAEMDQSLDEVVIEAEKSQTVFKLDKRVFNVGQDLSSSGAGALEVLNNVPSVNVNIEGQISLRGSNGVQVLINGKPSVLASDGANALGSITADMIDRVEVITNPSAKYEAEGTSGIINIVIKKEERKGMNGSVSVNTGWPYNHSIGLSLNRRTEKFNLFSQIGAGYRSMPHYNENINEDFISGTTILSEGTEYRNENFYNVILGTDYYINSTNVITLSGNFAYEIESQPSLNNFTLTNDTANYEWDREEVTTAKNPKWQYELQYKRDFKDHEDHDLLFSALGNLFWKDQMSEFENTTTSGNLPNALQQTATSFGEVKYTFKLDYTKPFSEKVKLETGGQYVIQDVGNDYSVTDFVDGEWVVNQGLTNNFEYSQNVLGVYTTGAYEGEKWGTKLGLRLENTELNTLLVNTNEVNNQNYTNLFPSIHTSYKMTERLSLQAGYSKRIYRPRLWDLNPFFNIRNNFSIRAGNPDLLPEFTDSYELNSIYILEETSLNLGVYHRYTTDVIERVSFFEDNVNTFKPINIGSNRSTGIEFNAKYSPKKWLVLNGDFNYNYFIRKGTFETTSFDFSADRWSSKVTSKFKLPSKIDLEITGRYESKFQTVQGESGSNLFADLGLRKKIKKGKAVINLSVRDIFASRRHLNTISQEDFYTYSLSRRGRFITLGFSYGFGKGGAMEYSGGRRR